MTIPAWAIPTVLTAAIWAWGILMPYPPSRGDYDFSGAFSAMFRLAVCIIGTLAFWLLFFMGKAAA